MARRKLRFVELSARQAAEALGKHPSTVRRWAREGRIPAERREGRWKVPVPTATAARALNLTPAQVRYRAERGQLRSTVATPEEIRRRYAPPPAYPLPLVPPPDLVDSARAGALDWAAFDRWISGPDVPRWVVDAVEGGWPIEATVIAAGSGAPAPSAWRGMTFEPTASGDAHVRITDDRGQVHDLGDMKLEQWTDLKRVVAAEIPDIEVEVEETPTAEGG